ncbi:MAG: Ycf66 family protein [Gloeotrichia echinulata GP01]
MLAYILAFAVGIGSLAIYLVAFFFPEIHRKNDFILSGVGLFYALILWVFSPRITGGLLLGHVASVALLWWFGWQTLSLRRQLTPQTEQTPVPSSETVKTSIQQQVTKLSVQQRLAQLQQGITGVFSGAKNRVQPTPSKKAPPTPSAPTAAKPAVEIIDNRTPVTEKAAEEAVVTESPTPVAEPPAEEKVTTESPTRILEKPTEETAAPVEEESKTDTIPQVIPPNPPSVELVEAAQPETEEKPPISLAEVAPDAVLAPPPEAAPEQKLPNNQAN